MTACATCEHFKWQGCAWANATTPAHWRSAAYARRQPTDGRWCRRWRLRLNSHHSNKEPPDGQ